MRHAILWAGLLLWFPGSLRSQTQPATATRLVVNGGFEEKEAGWQFISTGAKATGQLDEAEKHEGKYSYKLTNQSALTPNLFARIFQVLPGLRPYSTYRISCWVKGRGCGINWIGGGPGWGTRHWFPQGDFDWQQQSFEIDSGPMPDRYELMVLSESPTTALWVDDIRFEFVKADQAKQDAVYTQITSQVESLRRRVKDLEAQAEGNPRLTANPYLRLGTAVARRFIDFAQSGGTDGRTGLVWSQLQLEEVAQVLDVTENLARSGRLERLDWHPPKPGPVRLRKGTFYEGRQPHYFGGYGHFGAVINDLPEFPALGASLIQDGTAGPSSMNADGTLGAGALAVLKGLGRAAQYGMREDFLLSPHYYPAWADAPDLHPGNIGFIGFNIFHPKAKETIQQWITGMAERLKDKPALHSVCLANEPVYISSGRDPYSRPAFTAYLQRKHPNLAELNALYGTRCQSYDEVPVPPPTMPAGVPARRAYYDWTSFNKQMFADWHAGMGSLLKQHGVKAPTHTKIMVFQTLDRDKLAHGVDPELMCRATDLAGCDAYAFPGGAYAYDWFGHEFFYDLLHSFRGQSVFNSENHIIPDGTPPYHIPMSHTRSVLWQDGLHHQGSTTIWVWELAADPSLAGSIYFRPANVYGAGRAMLDLNRLAPEVTAINTAPPRVALLYSPPSVFWSEQYQSTLYSLYTVLTFMGENVTFVSERQLAERQAAKVPWLLVPHATHGLPSTPAALAAFAKSGGKVLLVGKDSLTRDEYDRPLTRADYPAIELGANEPATADALRQALAPPPFNELLDTATGKPAWGVEFRVVRQGRTTLITLNNFNKDAKTVSLPRWLKESALDLLNGERVSLKDVSLESMSPRLLRLD
ncbi:MAG: beta-galactosidase [Verrucomicrobiota bacterium]